jgi:hypothetical protein
MQGEGILGLAFQGISEHAAPTFIDLLYQEKQIDKKLFSFYLTRNVRRKGSRMILGGIDMSFAREKEFMYVPLVEDGFWAVGMAQLELKREGGEGGREGGVGEGRGGGEGGGGEGGGGGGGGGVEGGVVIPPVGAGTMMTTTTTGPVGSSSGSSSSSSSTISSSSSSSNSSNTLQLCDGRANCLAIVDTGTSFLGIPQKKLPAMLEFITQGTPSSLPPSLPPSLPSLPQTNKITTLTHHPSLPPSLPPFPHRPTELPHPKIEAHRLRL